MPILSGSVLELMPLSVDFSADSSADCYQTGTFSQYIKTRISEVEMVLVGMGLLVARVDGENRLVLHRLK